ncbi:hypothetical protein WKV44_01960 [Spirochaetia bacterium 38H-sp]|uniref:Uncharacterized protein n=1 Tax=Rarispira pelagica TaxID=3141764 RepID=A0ABU9U9F6_9SPIR
MIDGAYETELLNFLPRINRARGWRVYDKQGNRFIDLGMDGARAVLGYRPGLVNKYIKNALSKGVTTPFPSVYSFKLKQALKKWIPGLRNIVIFRDSYRLFSYLKSEMGIDTHSISDPALTDYASAVSYVRPFLSLPDSDFFIPVFPVPGFLLPAVLCSRKDVELPSDELANPVLLSAMTRSVFDIILAEKKNEFWQVTLECPDFFTQKGPYLVFAREFSDYPAVFRFFLDSGVILPVSSELPGVFPGEISDGELKKLQRLCLDAASRF